MTEKWEKEDKIAGFLRGAQMLGYSLEDAWKLFLTSVEGLGIQNDDYTYCVHHQGIASAEKADARDGANYLHESREVLDVPTSRLLATIIERAHGEYEIPYAEIFQRTGIVDFVSACGCVFGNYDDKLIREYLLEPQTENTERTGK